LTFLFDENISPAIVRALKELGKPVAYITDMLPRGTDDLTIFAKLGQLEWILVTQDQHIKRKKHEREAMKQAKIGAFIFSGRAEKDIDTMTILILKHFRQMENFAGTTKPPFIFGISDKGSIDRLD
jgi:predicted nuclease of predicted toxin-antitoxin system